MWPRKSDPLGTVIPRVSSLLWSFLSLSHSIRLFPSSSSEHERLVMNNTEQYEETSPPQSVKRLSANSFSDIFCLSHISKTVSVFM